MTFFTNLEMRQGHRNALSYRHFITHNFVDTLVIVAKLQSNKRDIMRVLFITAEYSFLLGLWHKQPSRRRTHCQYYATQSYKIGQCQSGIKRRRCKTFEFVPTKRPGKSPLEKWDRKWFPTAIIQKKDVKIVLVQICM